MRVGEGVYSSQNLRQRVWDSDNRPDLVSEGAQVIGFGAVDMLKHLENDIVADLGAFVSDSRESKVYARQV